MSQQYLKPSEVAAVFGVDDRTVKKWCVNGDIESRIVGGIFFIPKEALELDGSAFKSKRVVKLEEENERLREQIRAIQQDMRQIAGTLLQKGELY